LGGVVGAAGFVVSCLTAIFCSCLFHLIAVLASWSVRRASAGWPLFLFEVGRWKLDVGSSSVKKRRTFNFQRSTSNLEQGHSRALQAPSTLTRCEQVSFHIFVRKAPKMTAKGLWQKEIRKKNYFRTPQILRTVLSSYFCIFQSGFALKQGVC
jgi:hypothetical protein